MSTNAEVGIMHGDKCKSIYVHSDGYLDYLGKVLLANYDSTKANFLVAQGDCSMVGKTIGEKIDFNAGMVYDADGVAEQCRFYKRDRDEKDTDFKVSFSVEELHNTAQASYVYIMNNGVWFVSIDQGPLMLLSMALAAEVAA